MWKTLFILLLSAGVARAEEVDLELFLAVDVSRSMSPAELQIQRRGYAEALRSSEVVNAIEGGLIGTIAVTYVEWAGAQSQRVVVPWTRISGRPDAEKIARIIEEDIAYGYRRTSISGVLRYAQSSFDANEYKGLRRVIDVSGDGPNNSGYPVLTARDQVVADGITVNGLPLMTRDGLGLRWHLEDLDLYYIHCVIGGPGAFSIPVLTWDDFPAAVKRKLVLEIVGLPAERIWRAQNTGATAGGYDCLIGEKIWERNRQDWMLP